MKTHTIKLPFEQAEQLKEEFIKRGFKERKIENALWSLVGSGSVLNFYSSGTLVIQGKEADFLKSLVLSLVDTSSSLEIGCDESGKGDVFGPLVICCAVIKPEYYKKVLELNVKDCKKLKDEAVLEKAEKFKTFGEFECKIVEPLELNDLYDELKNLHKIMNMFYNQLLEKFLKKYPKANFFVDAYLRRNPFTKKIHFEHKAEKYLSVATASILARAEFLKWIKETNLPKGASPSALNLARNFYEKDQKEAKRFIKVFFFNLLAK